MTAQRGATKIVLLKRMTTGIKTRKRFLRGTTRGYDMGRRMTVRKTKLAQA